MAGICEREDLNDPFSDLSFLKTEELSLRLDRRVQGDPEKNRHPAYYFDILDRDGKQVGVCDLRIGYNDELYYGGNIGYAIDEPCRGRRYAAKACMLLFQLAWLHGMDHLFITCAPSNLAARRTCELLGGRFMELTELSPDHEARRESGQTHACIFRFVL